MKKKFSLWLNIATICLCICAIAVGVYSVQNATLDVTGQVGFKAHNCDVYVYGTASGAVDASENAMTPTYGTESAYINVHDDTSGWDMGAMNFTDIDAPAGKNAVDIVITLKMYNASKFDVKATFNTEFISSAGLTGKITATPSSSEIILSAGKTKADAQTMTITLTLATANDFSAISFNGEVLVNFARYEEQRLYIGEDNKLMMKMGHGTEKDNAKDVAIEWYAFAVLGEGDTYSQPTFANSYSITVGTQKWYSLKDSTMTLESAKNHTFWFIQKYIVSGGYKDSNNNQIAGVYFNNDSSTYKNMYKSDTDTSDIYICNRNLSNRNRYIK